MFVARQAYATASSDVSARMAFALLRRAAIALQALPTSRPVSFRGRWRIYGRARRRTVLGIRSPIPNYAAQPALPAIFTE